MKEVFENVAVEIVCFEEADIITSSTCPYQTPEMP